LKAVALQHEAKGSRNRTIEGKIVILQFYSKIKKKKEAERGRNETKQDKKN